MKFLGVNAAGAKSKWATFKKAIKETNTSIWFMQETKSTSINQLKMENYIIYEKVRDNGTGGGGVAIDAVREINPVLLSEGENNVEAITIDIHPKNLTISCVSAYGPQENHPMEKKTNFC